MRDSAVLSIILAALCVYIAGLVFSEKDPVPLRSRCVNMCLDEKWDCSNKDFFILDNPETSTYGD